MVDYLIPTILVALSALNIYLYFFPASPIRYRFGAKKAKSVTNGFAECGHCHHIVARYFIDGAGETTCANCKPSGYEYAVKNNRLNVK